MTTVVREHLLSVPARAGSYMQTAVQIPFFTTTPLPFSKRTKINFLLRKSKFHSIVDNVNFFGENESFILTIFTYRVL